LDQDSDSDTEVQCEEGEAEYATLDHNAKTLDNIQTVSESSNAMVSSSTHSNTHSMNQRLFTGNSIGRIRPMVKPREEVRHSELSQVAAGKAKHQMAVPVDPISGISRTGVAQAIGNRSGSVVDRNTKGDVKLLLSKQGAGPIGGDGLHAMDRDNNWDDTSPPRYTHPTPADCNNDSKSSGNLGGASLMSDHELVDLLRRPPKTTLVLRTKSNFQQFFKGVDRNRMHTLLATAYEDITDASERSLKIKKRMGLLDDAEA